MDSLCSTTLRRRQASLDLPIRPPTSVLASRLVTRVQPSRSNTRPPTPRKSFQAESGSEAGGAAPQAKLGRILSILIHLLDGHEVALALRLLDSLVSSPLSDVELSLSPSQLGVCLREFAELNKGCANEHMLAQLQRVGCGGTRPCVGEKQKPTPEGQRPTPERQRQTIESQMQTLESQTPTPKQAEPAPRKSEGSGSRVFSAFAVFTPKPPAERQERRPSIFRFGRLVRRSQPDSRKIYADPASLDPESQRESRPSADHSGREHRKLPPKADLAESIEDHLMPVCVPQSQARGSQPLSQPQDDPFSGDDEQDRRSMRSNRGGRHSEDSRCSSEPRSSWWDALSPRGR